MSQFLIVLAYVIIIFKSQGIILDKVRLNLLAKDFILGLIYIAVSRVKTFSGLYSNLYLILVFFLTNLTPMIFNRRIDIEKRA